MSEALHRLHEALGPEAGLVVVGGAVRDRLLGRLQGDVDLATPLLPEALMARARKGHLRTIPTGLQHGTVTVLVEGIPFEITTFRGDGDYLDGRHPVTVRLGVALEEDLARRDFTINALAVPLEAWLGLAWEAALVDPFGGRSDLEARVIRAVGDPLLRFKEDGLRPLRACRFAAQLAFDIEAATLAAIPERLDTVSKVAVERVFVELTKLLCGDAPGRGLSALEETGLLGLLLPEARPMVGCGQNGFHAWPVWEHTLAVVAAVPNDPAMRWAAFCHDLGKPETRTVGEDGRVHFYQHEGPSEARAAAILLRLRASRALQAEVAALVRHHGRVPEPEWSDAACRRFLGRLAEDGLALERWASFRLGDIAGKGLDPADDLARHARAMNRFQALLDARPALDVKALALDGRRLMALLGRKPGPWIGELQRHLLAQVLEEPARNTPETLEALARAWGQTLTDAGA